MRNNRISQKPVTRHRAHIYILIYLISFAGSVIVTRLFLELTGYPQIGNSELHFAHVLWGGLLLFASTLLPLVYANRWILPVSALLSGIGIGLFMDEVGKFITQNNDYFFPPAAPIIYAFVLITVWLFTRIRRQNQFDPRKEMYAVLDGMKEILDHDLEPLEREEMILRLTRVEAQDQGELGVLATEIKNYLISERVRIIPAREYRIRMRALETRARIDRILAGGRWRISAGLGLFLVAIFAFGELFGVLLPIYRFQIPLGSLLHLDLASIGLSLSISPIWYLIHIALQMILAILALISSLWVLLGGKRRAIDLGVFVTVTSLTIINLLAFYVNQFSASIDAIVQLIVFLGLIYVRDRFLPVNPVQ